MLALSLLTYLLFASTQTQAANSRFQHNSSCRCFPGDACWPCSNVWSKLNATIDGRLIATVPLGRPCHAPYYDANECAILRAGWQLPEEQ